MFSFPNTNVVNNCFDVEDQFMVAPHFYTSIRNREYRKLAVSTIAKLCEGEVDTYIPYQAMTYFDRFISRNPLSNLEGRSENDKVMLVAICCLTLSSKMRADNFMFDQCLMMDQCEDLGRDAMMRMELHIVKGLRWQMIPVTPFDFLDYYYHGWFKTNGVAYQRNCINEIILESQGEDYSFTEYKPSQIAKSAFLAVTYLTNRGIFETADKTEEEIRCARDLVNLCRKRGINVKSDRGNEAAAAGEAKMTEEPEKLMNFELQ